MTKFEKCIVVVVWLMTAALTIFYLGFMAYSLVTGYRLPGDVHHNRTTGMWFLLTIAVAGAWVGSWKITDWL